MRIPPSNLTGVWVGYVQTQQTEGSLEVELLQAGGALTGLARLTIEGSVFDGPVAGTLSGERVSAKVEFEKYGVVNYSGAASNADISGVYVRAIIPGVERGSLLLHRSLRQTANVAGTWVGSYRPDSQSLPEGELATAFQQDGNSISGVVTFSPSNGDPYSSTLNGLIIGVNITFRIVNAPSGPIQFTATVKGNVFEGAYQGTESGTFTVKLGE